MQWRFCQRQSSSLLSANLRAFLPGLFSSPGPGLSERASSKAGHFGWLASRKGGAKPSLSQQVRPGAGACRITGTRVSSAPGWKLVKSSILPVSPARWPPAASLHPPVRPSGIGWAQGGWGKSFHAHATGSLGRRVQAIYKGHTCCGLCVCVYTHSARVCVCVCVWHCNQRTVGQKSVFGKTTPLAARLLNKGLRTRIFA